MSLKKAAFPSKSKPRCYQKSGIYAARAAILNNGSKPIDKRTQAGRSIQEWKAAIISDLGGEEELTTAKQAIVDLAVKNMLLIGIIDKFVFQEQAVVNKRSRSLFPIINQRQALADSLIRYLTTLGLERVAKRVPALSEYLAEKASEETPKKTHASKQAHESGSGKFAKKAADIETSAEVADDTDSEVEE
jgi:hypothetical protein